MTGVADPPRAPRRPHLQGLRRLLALGILACFFLPLCQCTPRAPPPDARGVAKPPAVVVYVPAALVASGDLDQAPVVLGFAWPLLAVALARRVRARGRAAALVLDLAEIALAATTGWYVVQVVRLYGEIRFGGVLLLACLAGFLATSLVALRRDALDADDDAGLQRQRSPRPRR